MEFDDLPEEQSRFQKYNTNVLKFLEDQMNKPNEEKLIYQHQIEAVLAVKQYFSNKQNSPALVGNIIVVVNN